MRNAFFTLLLLLPFMTQAQTYVLEKDSLSDAVILKGQCRYTDLLAQPGYTWMKEANDYRVDKDALAVLQKKLPNYEMVVLFGSWCSDSHLQLPHLYKIVQDAQMPPEKVTLYGFDRAKKARDTEDRIFHLERVPTIIVLKNHREVGRIVETPRKSLEKDLVEIIEKE